MSALFAPEVELAGAQLDRETNAWPAFTIGGVLISPPVVLAPMADVTNGAYRRLVKRIAAPGLVVTELISTMAVHYRSRRTMTMFDVTPDQRPLSVQLFGSDVDIMAEAARVAAGEGADIIDINMGCWVPKVCKTGGGAAMMQDEPQACRIVGAVVRATPLPVTVKMRAGWHYGHLATAGLARKLELEGVAGFALHGRFASQGHTGSADWNLIAEMKQELTRPLIGNGDIRSPEDAIRMLRQTGCDGVMVGRAAIGNPWLVRDVVAAVQGNRAPPPPGWPERVAAALEHLTDLAAQAGEDVAVRHLRGQLPQYVKGMSGASKVRDAIVRSNTIAEVRHVFAEALQGAG
ncbi:MAG: tRNA dihydrouridine synthase DusB [Armatimonadetes bacterium]|nr:tRNA dihydrouridine synthase DusB [Armatimonadota bacterium]MDE2205804.1 tRNA dihydrouridine synthase DusB [Armatimonadota bacterium]